MANSSKYDVNDCIRPTAVELNDGATVSIEKDTADKTYRDTHLDLLNNIHILLEKILNHQRQITGIEIDKGEEY